MVRFLISMTKEMRDMLKSIAEQRGQTLCGLIRQILWEWAEGRKPEGGKNMKGEEHHED